jgi:LytR cell envelope-related transcriptional attenuator
MKSTRTHAEATCHTFFGPGTCHVRSAFPAPAAAVMARRMRPRAVAAAANAAVPVAAGSSSAGWSARAARVGAAGVLGASLIGCASFPLPTSTPVAQQRVAPVLRLDNGPLTADGAYTAGKQALQEGRVYLALMHFERAASLRPDWADAQNGRMVALARMGRPDEAMRVAGQAIAAGAASPEIHGNLGLLQQANGQPAAAAASFAKAAQLDPSNVVWSESLAAVKAQPAVAAAPPPAAPAAVVAPPVQAAAPAAVVTMTPAATPPVAAGAPRLAMDLPYASTSGNVPSPRLQWLAQAPNVLELKMDLPRVTVPAAPAVAAAPATPVAPAAAVAAAPVGVAAVATPALRMTVEVSNGAGRNGLAKGTAQALRSAGVSPSRVTNHTNFKVQQTEIQYRTADDAAAARELARSFSLPVVLVENPALRAGVTVRVVLGRDAVPLAAQSRLVRAPASPTPVVAGVSA